MANEYKLSYTASDIDEKLGQIDNKVDKVTGKGLSSNDYTDAAKAKVDAIPENPQYTDTVFSGSYNDLRDKPIIPDISGKQDKLVAGTGITIAADGKTISSSGGITPHIGDNGNWYLGDTDTGKPSRGAAGAKGDKGDTGPQGAPGIYYGTTQPTGDAHPVWIDPDGDQDDGGLLPVVTTNDNGKFLRVVNGAWAATATQMATTSEVNAVSTRVSTLENAGYLTLATLPKYGGESE